MVHILLLSYFSIATAAFRIALVQESYHGVSSFTKKYVARICPPKRSQMRLMGVKLSYKV